MSAGEHLDGLLADLKRQAARQALRRRLVDVEVWQDGKKVHVPHVLTGGTLRPLTAEEIGDLNNPEEQT
jgi:hypothetical protein